MYPYKTSLHYFGRDPSLRGLWLLDGRSTSEIDFSGNGNTGTQAGNANPDWFVGSQRLKLARRFTGTNGDYIGCGTGASLDVQGAITLIAWFNVTAAANAFLILKGTSALTAGTLSYFLRLLSTKAVSFGLSNGTSVLNLNSAANQYRLNQPTCVIATWEGSSGQTWRIFLNGIQIATGNSGITMASKPSVPLVLGSSGLGGAQAITGSLGETLVLARAISPLGVSDYYTTMISGARYPRGLRTPMVSSQKVLQGGGLGDQTTLMGGMQ